MKKNTPAATFARLKRIPLNLHDVDFGSFEMANVDRRDYPDFCDAYIEVASFLSGRDLSDDEMEQLNEHSDIVYEAACESIY